MKKFTALMLVALLVVMAFPFASNAATATKVGTVAELAAIADGDYVLTADIDLSKATWTTIPEFSGTLDGNGYTITMPTDAPVFGKITGTVKNVNLKGTVTLGAEDVSTDKYVFITTNVDLVAAGTLANVVDGGTVEQVTSDLNVTFNLAEADKTVVGGLVGIVRSESAEKAATIKNVLVKGSVKTTQKTDNNAETFGGLVGGVEGNVTIDKVDVQSALVVDGCKGNRAGVAGYVNEAQAGEAKQKALAVMTNVVFSGNAQVKGESLSERFGGIIGYGRCFTLKNSAFVGTYADENSGSMYKLVGYARGSSAWHGIIIEDCLAAGTAPASTLVCRVRVNSGKDYAQIIDLINVAGVVINGKSPTSADSDAAAPANTVEKPTAAEATTAFRALEGNADIYEVVDGKLTIKNVGKTVHPFETIDTPEEFAAFTKAVNAGTYVPSGTVKITADLDMKGITDYEPLNKMQGFNYDFQNHTISNLVVTTEGTNNGKATESDGAIIANKVVGAKIENLKLYNCMLIANNINRAALVAGDFNRGGINNITVENCTLKANYHPESKTRYACAVIAAYNYDTEVHANIVVKNVLLDAPEARFFTAFMGCNYKATRFNVDSAVIENVTANKGETLTAVENLLGEELTTLHYDPANVTVTNTANATGYVDPNAPVVPPTPDTPDTPVTGDMTVYFAVAGIVALAGVVVVKKKIRN